VAQPKLEADVPGWRPIEGIRSLSLTTDGTLLRHCGAVKPGDSAAP
jgi:hypothetical protein